MAAPRSIRRRLFRLIANPLATLILGLLLLGDVTTVLDRKIKQRTTAPLAAPAWSLSWRGAAVPPLDRMSRDRIIDPEYESWDELGTIVAASPHEVVFVNAVFVPDQPRGLWAVTKKVTTVTITLVTGTSDAPAPADAERIKAILADHLADDPAWAPRLSLMRSATPQTGGVYAHRATQHRWQGYVHNALSLTAAILFLVSLAWIPAAPGRVRARLAARALARGRCPSCGYDITALRKPTCPECGERLPVPAQEGAQREGRPRSK